MEATTGTELALPAETGLADILRADDALEKTLRRIEAEARSQVLDTATAKGRKAIASLAYKIAQTKTALDSAGKESNAGLRAQIETVDAARRKVRERLDDLKAEIRKPLDQWEEAEEKRVAGLRTSLSNIGTGGLDAGCDPAEIAEALDHLRSMEIGDDWQEYREQAEARRADAVRALTDAHRLAFQRVEQEAELAKLRAEAEERRRRDEAEEAERVRLERERQEAAEAERRKAEEERQAAERAAAAERERQKAAEEARWEADERAKREAAEAAIRAEEAIAAERRAREEAEIRAAEAAEAERRRIAEEERLRKEAEDKRRADETHRARILAEIKEALSPIPREGIPQALLDGRVPHVKVII
jgi:hypothetical protein